MGLFAAHPTRLRYTVFWDVLNFFSGQNTPEAEYKHAPGAPMPNTPPRCVTSGAW